MAQKHFKDLNTSNNVSFIQFYNTDIYHLSVNTKQPQIIDIKTLSKVEFSKVSYHTLLLHSTSFSKNANTFSILIPSAWLSYTYIGFLLEEPMHKIMVEITTIQDVSNMAIPYQD